MKRTLLFTIAFCLLSLGAQAQGIISTVDEESDDIIKLSDGSIVENTSYSYLPYFGYSDASILFVVDEQTYLAVEGVWTVDVLKLGSITRSVDLELDTVRLAKDDTIVLESGRIFTTYDYPVWLRHDDVVVSSSGHIINLTMKECISAIEDL